MNRGFFLRRGFTLIELLTVIAIFGIVMSITLVAFVSYRHNQALELATHSILSALAEARSMTLSSINAKRYGIHIETNSITLFQGSEYSASDPSNVVNPLDSAAEISAFLSGGGSDVVFERLTGNANTSGTILITSVSDPSKSAMITLYSTGVAEVDN
jgi:prepilin-type N-terminal cleavage/methylation domain-containing protein